jgi:RimJ/RimL family protein N-acetyltransferase
VKIRLEPFTEADIERLIDWIPTAEFLLQWGGSGFDFPLTRRQLLAGLDRSRVELPDRLIYRVVAADTTEVVGHGEILSLDRRNRSAVLGRILVGSPELRGTGIGRQLVRELLRVCFEELRLHRVSLRVYDFNAAAIHCYEKAGFQREGLQRDIHKIGDQYWSVYTMSVLEHEWSPRRL